MRFLLIFFLSSSLFAEPGIAFLIAGPSGSGKTTLVNLVLKDQNDQLSQAILYTTRPIRKGEIEGSDYYFVSSNVFDDLWNQGKIFHYVEFDQYRYGYPIEILENLAQGQSFIMIIGTSGAARALQCLWPHSVLIWIDVSDMETIKKRLDARNSNQDLSNRRYEIARAQREEERVENLFHYHILNDDGQLEKSVIELRNIINQSFSKNISELGN